MLNISQKNSAELLTARILSIASTKQGVKLGSTPTIRVYTFVDRSITRLLEGNAQTLCSHGWCLVVYFLRSGTVLFNLIFAGYFCGK